MNHIEIPYAMSALIVLFRFVLFCSFLLVGNVVERKQCTEKEIAKRLYYAYWYLVEFRSHSIAKVKFRCNSNRIGNSKKNEFREK